ncbi:hypothetical protein C8R46DRAFT_1052481, partial [Mycena filopes]
MILSKRCRLLVRLSCMLRNDSGARRPAPLDCFALLVHQLLHAVPFHSVPPTYTQFAKCRSTLTNILYVLRRRATVWVCIRTYAARLAPCTPDVGVATQIRRRASRPPDSLLVHGKGEKWGGCETVLVAVYIWRVEVVPEQNGGLPPSFRLHAPRDSHRASHGGRKTFTLEEGGACGPYL